MIMPMYKLVGGVLAELDADEEAEVLAARGRELLELPERERQAHNAPILAEIEVLDRFIPRGLEDLITALAVDVTTLPQVQQGRLARKAALRGQLL